MQNYTFRKIEQGEIPCALNLCWKVFLEFEAPDYADIGVEEFHQFLDAERIAWEISMEQFSLHGCFDGGSMVGVLGVKLPNHISLLFVDKLHHRRGVARTLVESLKGACAQSGESRITVNSSPYAIPVYHKLGFTDVTPEQTVNGIRFTPMMLFLA